MSYSLYNVNDEYEELVEEQRNYLGGLTDYEILGTFLIMQSRT